MVGPATGPAPASQTRPHSAVYFTCMSSSGLQHMISLSFSPSTCFRSLPFLPIPVRFNVQTKKKSQKRSAISSKVATTPGTPKLWSHKPPYLSHSKYPPHLSPPPNLSLMTPTRQPFESATSRPSSKRPSNLWPFK